MTEDSGYIPLDKQTADFLKNVLAKPGIGGIDLKTGGEMSLRHSPGQPSANTKHEGPHGPSVS